MWMTTSRTNVYTDAVFVLRDTTVPFKKWYTSYSSSSSISILVFDSISPLASRAFGCSLDRRTFRAGNAPCFCPLPDNNRIRNRWNCRTNTSWNNRPCWKTVCSSPIRKVLPLRRFPTWIGAWCMVASRVRKAFDLPSDEGQSRRVHLWFLGVASICATVRWHPPSSLHRSVPVRESLLWSPSSYLTLVPLRLEIPAVSVSELATSGMDTIPRPTLSLRFPQALERNGSTRASSSVSDWHFWRRDVGCLLGVEPSTIETPLRNFCTPFDVTLFLREGSTSKCCISTLEIRSMSAKSSTSSFTLRSDDGVELSLADVSGDFNDSALTLSLQKSSGWSM